MAGQNRSIFPSPWETLGEAFIYLGEGFTYKCLWGTLWRTIVGFTVSALLAFFIGVLVGNFTSLKHVFNPTMVALRAIPTAAVTFLFLMMAGLKNAPMYVVGVIVFPMVYEATVSGFNNIDPTIIMALKVDTNSNLYSNLKVKIPLAFPYIALGLITSFGLSLKIEIMAEVISGSSSYGLGRAIQSAYLNSTNGMVPTFAYSFIAILIMLIFTLIFAIIKKVFKLEDLISK